jgi:allophanate hydrolase subunit 2
MTHVEVLAPGALTTIQDLGRPGWAHVGVPRSGAADRPALVLANRLLGNDDGDAALETTLAGPRLRFDGPTDIALTGAPVRARVGERPVPLNEAFRVRAGDELRSAMRTPACAPTSRSGAASGCRWY